MKTLIESLLDDDLTKNTSIEGITMSTFPNVNNVEYESGHSIYYWRSNYLKQATRLNIDCITASWVDDYSDSAIRLTIGKEGYPDFMWCADIETSSNNPKKIKELAYSIMELMRDNLSNLKKFARYCSKSEFKHKLPELYKIDLYDILKK